MVGEQSNTWPPGSSEMAGRIRAFDWSVTSLGPIAGWASRLKLAVEMTLVNPLVTYVVCGSGRILIYNDATAAMLGSMHPHALGQSASTFFTAARAVMEPLYDRAFTGEAVRIDAQPVELNGKERPRAFDLVLTPIGEEGGRVTCVQVTGFDVSGRLAAEQERDRTVEGLRASEARLRLALDASRMGVWTYDPATNSFGVDARAAEITGVAPGEGLPASSIWLAAHSEDRSLLQARLADMLDPQGDHWNEAIARFVHPDGTERWTQARAHSVLAGEGSQRVAVRVLGTILDITESKKAEAALRQSEQRFRAFVTASSDAIYHMSADWSELQRLDDRGVLADRPVQTGAWMDRYLRPEDQPTVRAMIAQAAWTKTAVELEHRVHRADGTLGWVYSRAVPIMDECGEVREWLGTASDVTARKLTEEALRESEKRFRAVANLGPNFLWSSDPQGRATWFSERWYTYTGQSEVEALGYGWHEAIHHEDREPTMARFFSVVEHGKVFSHEYRIRRQDGSYRWFLVRAGPIHDETGQIAQCYGAVTDIDDLRKLQERQAVMVDELQHRTRNLLTVVRSIAQETMAQTGPTERFRAQFNDRLAALSRVQSLLSRSEQTPVTIRTLIQAEFDALGPAVMQGRVALEGPTVSLRKGDVQTLALAIHELATNARKYGALSSDQGELWVSWDSYTDETGKPRLALVWLEEGISPAPERRNGYGRKLIEQALPYALRARTSYELSDAELRCTIDLPLK